MRRAKYAHLGADFRRVEGNLLRIVVLLVILFSGNSGHTSELVIWGSNSSGQTNSPPTATNLVAVAAGQNHSLALREDGVVIAWGSNLSGESAVPESATNVVAIAARGNTSMALREDGKVLVWGSGSYGQTNVPAAASNVVSIAAGDFHCLALRADGQVIAWGSNSYGQTRVPASATNVAAISAGRFQSVGLRRDGRLVGWGGWGVPSRLSSLLDICAIEAGGDKTILIRADGSLLGWGTSVPSSATNIVAIAAGTNSCLALRTDGRLLAWGTGPSVNVPASASNLIAVAVGAAHGLALKSDGRPKIFGQIGFANIVSPGDPLPLVARAVGRSPLHFQWLADGKPVPASDRANPAIAASVSGNLVDYQVVVSNAIGLATSGPVKVAVRRFNVWGDNVVGQTRIPDGATNTAAIAAGAFHCLALSEDGSVLGWGSNRDGQSSIPHELAGIVEVAAGSDHSLAVRDDGSVFAWGRNWDGQAQPPLDATNLVAVAAGWAHSVALRADGTVLAWGNDEYGQAVVPAVVTEVTAIAAGYYHSLALKADGSVVSWGWDNDVPLDATNVVAISAGWGHSIALKQDGSVMAWGDNSYGQSSVPASVTNVVAISASYFHSMALRGDGSVVAWGKGFFGATNVPAGLERVNAIETGEHFSMALVASDQPRFYRQRTSVAANAGGMAILNGGVNSGRDVLLQWIHDGVAVAGATNRSLILRGIQLSDAGNYTLVASTPSGMFTNQPTSLVVRPDPVSYSAIQTWGDEANQQLKVPKTVANPTAISAGAYHSLALNGDGTVVGWGKNWDRQASIPRGLSNVAAVAAGGDHSMALRSDGSVVAWGRNWDGQTNAPSSATNIATITAGWAHSVALGKDGRIVAWGNNEYGQLAVPSFLSNVVAVAAGYYHTLALRSDRTIVAWGLDEAVPLSATNVVAIAAGWGHSLALRSDGSIVAWGDNSYGQCEVPESLTKAVSISAGYAHSMAVLSDGSGVVWGRGFFGATNIPAALRNLTSLAAGENHSLALVESGPPRLSGVPEQGAHVGGGAALSVQVAGTRPVELQWYHEGGLIEGATDPWLFLSNLPASASGTYALVASNAVGVSTQMVDLVLRPEPSLDQSPAKRILLVGSPAHLRVEASGAEPLDYRWRRNGIDLQDGERVSGASSPDLWLDPAEYGDTGDYSIVLQNLHGSLTGLVAKVVVTPILGWGNNSFGQLDTPEGATNIVALAVGDDHNLALRADGTVVAWGDDSVGQTSVPASATNVVAIAASGRHSMALRSDGTIIDWGAAVRGFSVPAEATNVVAIANGIYNLALQADGNVLALPQSDQGAVPAFKAASIASGPGGGVVVKTDGTVAGIGLTVPSSVTDVVQVAPGGRQRLALRIDGSVIDWRFPGAKVPVSATNVVGISAGRAHSLALRADGTVVAWGEDDFGETDVPAFATNLVAVAAGEGHSLALSAAGQRYLTPVSTSKMVKIGEPVLLRSFASGSGLVRYQWKLDGVDIPGATNRFLSLQAFRWAQAGSYSLVVGNRSGSVTNPPIFVTIDLPPLLFDGTSTAVLSDADAMKIRLLGVTGSGSLVLYASTNLTDWTPVFTNPPSVEPVDFQMPVLPDGHLFFRASEEVGP